MHFPYLHSYSVTHNKNEIVEPNFWELDFVFEDFDIKFSGFFLVK